MLRVPFTTLERTIQDAFEHAGMIPEKAAHCARIHAESTLDGVQSHGLNRVERFIDYIYKGWVDIHAEPSLVQRTGSMEIWDGNLGPGVLNAMHSMQRAIDIAKEGGMGIVSLRNTTHWMRGGTYGWHAASQGCISICWTNTESCMPAWGATSECIGNNPLIISIPNDEGHIVLDMAMSQYSYGRLQVTRLKNEKLPFPGGFDELGKLTGDPHTIETTRRILPTGYWKGSGLAVVLDLVAALLSGGRTTAEIDRLGKGSCGSCCQVFIVFDPTQYAEPNAIRASVTGTIHQLRSALPAEDADAVYYPGERTLATRKENLVSGVPVNEEIWNSVCRLAYAD